MKKISSIAIAAAIMMSPSVFAAEYDLTENSVSKIDDNTYQTVLIFKEGDSVKSEDIVYVGQTENGSLFTSAAKFMLKENLEDGKYYLRLGGKPDGGSCDQLTFYIGMPIQDGDIKCDKIFDEEGNLGFAWENVNSPDYNSILIKLGSGIFGYSLPTISGDANIGVYITDVPEEITEVEAYLSRNIVSDKNVDLNGGKEE